MLWVKVSEGYINLAHAQHVEVDEDGDVRVTSSTAIGLTTKVYDGKDAEVIRKALERATLPKDDPFAPYIKQ